jgi:N-methylhydantoinase A
MSRYDIGVDIGGTFSDIVCIPEEGGEIVVAKVLSTPPAFIHGVLSALKKANVDPRGLKHFLHGSTIATNAIIERKGARTGLITTEGFRDVLEAARAERPDMYDLRWDPPAPLVPRPNRLGVRERVDYEGAVLEPLDEAAVRRAAELFEKRRIEAVAICFLNAFVNPIHEQRAKAIVRTILPEAYVCTSSEVFPEIREFERSSTTVVNAYLGPIVDHYLRDLQAHIKGWGYDGEVTIVHSGGGMMSADSARALPARTCNSGPAAGVIGGAYIGSLAGFPNVITFDMGGTSADLSLVYRGQPLMQPGSKVEFTIPVRFPCIDLVSIGAGGGSIAWVDRAGTLRNGPQSAGATPGPACYGKGGTEPTNTDANLVLGRIDPENFLGGEMVLRQDLAARAIETKVAKVFGMSLEQAAEGIVRLADANMIEAIRLISVARGYDPRDFALVAFGGAGPLHAVALARELHIPTVVVPRFPGVTSAFGALRVEVRHDFIQAVFQKESEFDPDRLNRIFAELEDRARKTLRGEGLAEAQMHFARFADVKYFPQNKYLTMPVPDGVLGHQEMRGVVQSYIERYLREFGYTIPTDIAEVEICSARLMASGSTRKAELPRVAGGGGTAEPRASRPVYFREAGGFVPAAVFDKAALGPGTSVAGPAILEQMDTSIVIPPGASAAVDPYLNVIINVSSPSASPSPKRAQA